MLIVKEEQLGRFVPIAGEDGLPGWRFLGQDLGELFEPGRRQGSEVIQHNHMPAIGPDREKRHCHDREHLCRRAVSPDPGRERIAANQIREHESTEERRGRNGILGESLRDESHEGEHDEARKNHPRPFGERHAPMDEHEGRARQKQDQGQMRKKHAPRIHRKKLHPEIQIHFLGHREVHDPEVLHIEKEQVLRKVGVNEHPECVRRKSAEKERLLPALLKEREIGPADERENERQKRRHIGERIKKHKRHERALLAVQHEVQAPDQERNRHHLRAGSHKPPPEELTSEEQDPEPEKPVPHLIQGQDHEETRERESRKKHGRELHSRREIAVSKRHEEQVIEQAAVAIGILPHAEGRPGEPVREKPVLLPHEGRDLDMKVTVRLGNIRRLKLEVVAKHETNRIRDRPLEPESEFHRSHVEIGASQRQAEK